MYSLSPPPRPIAPRDGRGFSLPEIIGAEQGDSGVWGLEHTLVSAIVLAGAGGGGVSIKVFECDKHDRCTMAMSTNGIACCRICKDYEGASD